MDKIIDNPLMTPKISIIIPCYNSGEYLPEALNSIEFYPHKDVYEVIIVNDGSTDIDTLKFLKNLKQRGYTIIDQENRGPAAARNTGVAHSKGEYLLFVDSDNKIRSSYIDLGIQILNTQKDIGVVYGKPSFFGAIQLRHFTTQSFDFERLLGENYIDVCAVVRKKVWKDVNGFDENRILIGHEDWDFWIKVSKSGWKFYYINEVMFDYRIRANSLITDSTSPEKKEPMFEYLVSKNVDVYSRHYFKIFYSNMYYSQDEKRPFRTLIKHLYKKYFKK